VSLRPLLEQISETLDGLTGDKRSYAVNAIRRACGDVVDPQPAPPETALTEQQAHEFGRIAQLYGRPISQVPAEDIAKLVDQHRLQWSKMLAYLQWRNRQ
jgi:hypothetical protein